MINFKSKTILFCDLDGTLIKTASGKTFPEDFTDFRIRKEVFEAIKKFNDKVSLRFIAIVTNQGGIPEYISKTDFETKIKTIAYALQRYTNVPVCMKYCASLDKNDKDRKPNVGMLDFFYKTSLGDTIFKKYEAIMIGDASGKEGQFSDSDKKTAENFRIDYIDVEDFIRMKL